MKSKNPLFSIIIPVYNSERTIKSTILSILRQNLNDIEIIIIDDCSNDETINSIKNIISKKISYKIFKQKKNKGVWNCRNKGIKIARGKYIIFLDSDDFLEDNALIELKNYLNLNKNAEIIMVEHNMSPDGNFYSKKNVKILNNENKIKLINSLPHFTGYCWRFILNRKFLINKKINFINVKVHEDEEFVNKIIYHSSSINFLKKKFFFHYVFPDSLSLTIGIKNIDSCLRVLNSLSKYFFLKNISKQKKYFCFTRIKIILRHLFPLLLLVKKEELSISSNYIKRNKKNFIKINKIFNKDIFIFNGYKKNILDEIRINIEMKSISKILKSKKNNFFIFCMDKYGFATYQILKKYNFKIKGFFDNNKYYSGRKMFGLRHHNLNRKIAKNKNVFVIISNQSKKHIKEIGKQLINTGFSKNRIYYKSYDVVKNFQISKF